jgi:GH18 family chitinase
VKAKFGDNTKVLIAVGGWGDAGFSVAAANATTRELFASNVATMLNATDADGLGKIPHISPLRGSK